MHRRLTVRDPAAAALSTRTGEALAISAIAPGRFSIGLYVIFVPLLVNCLQL